MNRLLFLLFLLGLKITAVYSQLPGWVYKNPVPCDVNLNSIQFVDEHTGFAVGNAGVVLTTSDAGTSWVMQESGTRSDLRSVFFINADTGFAVGNGGVLKTINGGIHWDVQKSKTGSKLLSVFFINDSTGWATGYGNSMMDSMIMKTTDYGENWTVQDNPFNITYLNSVFFVDERIGYAVGGLYGSMGHTYAQIVKTVNGGSEWIKKSTPVYDMWGLPKLNAIYFLSANTGFAVGDFGVIIKTVDGGEHWALQKSGTTNELFSISFADSRTGFIVGSKGTILKTENGGESWERQESGTTTALSSVSFTDKNTAYTSGETGTILRIKNDAGSLEVQSLQPQSIIDVPDTLNSAPKILNSVYFINTNQGFAAAANEILKTDDAGESWYVQKIPRGGIISVHFNNPKGYAVGNGGTILKTDNEGEEWSLESSGTTQSLYSVYITDEGTGYAVGEGGTILRKENRSAKWLNQVSGTTNRLRSVVFVNDSIGYAAGDEVILKTINRGKNWTALKFPETYILSLFFVNENTGYALSKPKRYSGYLILKTIDGGVSWREQANGKGLMSSVFFIDESTGWISGNGTILKTTDGGVSWIVQSTWTQNWLLSLFFTDAQTGFAVGKNGIILKTNDGGAFPFLNVSTHRIVIPSQQINIKTFNINSNVRWTLKCDVPWLTLNIYIGSNDQTITMTAADNAEKSQRRGTITVLGGGVPRDTIFVTQLSQNDGEYEVFPNPSSTELFIGGIDEDLVYSISDLNGKIIVNRQEYKDRVDISSLEPGMYVISVESYKGRSSRKFIKF